MKNKLREIINVHGVDHVIVEHPTANYLGKGKALHAILKAGETLEMYDKRMLLFKENYKSSLINDKEIKRKEIASKKEQKLHLKTKKIKE